MDRDNTIARLENIAKHAVHTAGEDTFVLSLDDGLAIHEAIEALKAQHSQEGTTSDTISKFIDGLEETFAYVREREGGDSVCGLCEYDGAYIGESGDWCNECPGFDRDDCFKLSDETRKKWTDEIIKALPPAQPETLTDKEQRIFLAAMGREEKVCRQVDDECGDCRDSDSLVRTCHEITRKVKGTLWT